MYEFQSALVKSLVEGSESWAWAYEGDDSWVAYCPYTDAAITGVNGKCDDDPVELYRDLRS